MDNKHIGSSLDDWLREEGIYEEARVEALTSVLAFRAKVVGQQSTSASLITPVPPLHPEEK